MSAESLLISRADNVAWVASPDRVVLVRLVDVAAPPVMLAGSAGAIWEQLEGELTLDQLVLSVAERFGIDMDEIHEEVAAFVSDGVERGLMHARALAP